MRLSDKLNGPNVPWTGEHHHTTHIHSSTGTAGYSCYDIDIYDHQAQCNGTATDSSVNCETNFTQADTFDAADCQPGCTYTAPVMRATFRQKSDNLNYIYKISQLILISHRGVV